MSIYSAYLCTFSSVFDFVTTQWECDRWSTLRCGGEIILFYVSGGGAGVDGLVVCEYRKIMRI